MTAPPSLSTRLELGHALAQWCADQESIRVLHIKGLAAQSVLPLEAMQSVDVDVLVEPASHHRFLSRLTAAATSEVTDDASASSEGHAVEVVNRGLGVSLDVHSHFPGCRAPAGRVFDELWMRAEERRFGGWPCRVLDPVGSTFLGLVHAARNPPTSRSHRNAMRRWEMLAAPERDALHRLVRDVHAQAAIHVVLGAYPDANRWEVALFRAHQQRRRPATLWLLTLLAAPDRRAKLHVLRRALASRRGRVRGAVGPTAAALRDGIPQGRRTRG